MFPQVSAAEREQAYNEARQRILYGLTPEQQRQQHEDRAGGVASEVDCFSAQEVAMAAAAAVFGGDDERCVAICLLRPCVLMRHDALQQGRFRF
jgi:hypothetical protein